MPSSFLTTQLSSGVIRPRLSVQYGNTTLPVPQRVEVRTSRMAEAATFSAVFASSLSAPLQLNLDSSSSFQIFRGFSDDDLTGNSSSQTKLFSGSIDHIEYHPSSGTVQVSGRDWSAALMALELSGLSFMNMSAAEAMTQLAQSAGLEADIDATDGFVGQFYQYEHKAHGLAGMHRYQTAWDFCVGMQRHYGYDLWVDDRTLHFRKPDENTDIITLNWSDGQTSSSGVDAAVLDMRMSHRPLYTEGVSVTVSAWDARQKVVHSASWPEGAASGQMFTFTAPVGTTLDQCLVLVKQRYGELAAHGRTIRMDVNPALDLSVRQKVRIQGTATSFDALVYTIDEIVQSFAEKHATQSLMLRPRDIQ
ncbi:hypothetical protein [Acetobacter estunensis]|uniref:hypothetical protein n=1 Tax=Acetobacter estunensis TaxID=104097 RepID=UPI001C2D8FC5|nr:hypothetical protein [Acetobacter estunensis]MBV1838614.1 hypothetical protein [Acetobacter estunensis]